MTKSLALQKEEILKEINELRSLIEEKEAALNKLSTTSRDWQPSEFESYYYVDSLGTVVKDFHLGSGPTPEVAKIVRIFKTNEEAEKEVLRLFTLRALEHYSYVPETLNELVWVITYSEYSGIEYRQYQYGDVGGLCYKTLERAKEAVAEVSSYNVINRYFELSTDISDLYSSSLPAGLSGPTPSSTDNE